MTERSPTPTPTVTLYGRPGCHLCDDARAALERVRARAPFALEERDITQDDALHLRYLERIPVVCVDGQEIFESFVSEDELLSRLREPPASGPRPALPTG